MSSKGRTRTFPRVCENCGTRPLEEFVIPGVLLMWHCPRCDLYQQGRLPTVEHYNGSYHHSYALRRPHKLKTAAARLARIAGRVEMEKPRLLDIGCSLGVIVEMAAQFGWDAEGIDISADAVELCRQRGLNCRVGQAVDLPYDDEVFDIVTAWHLIEHLDNAAVALAEWSRVLKPGGLLVLETPDSSCLKVRLLGSRYRRFWTPEHLYVFNRKNLAPIVENAGFEIISTPMLGRLGPLPPKLALYSVSYRLHKLMMRCLGLDKAFLLFCRRKQVAAVPQALYRAA